MRAKLEAEVPTFNIRMGRELGAQMMLILLVALAYAAVSPLILPFALWWFAASWLMWRYSILYVFERCYESGGVVRVRLNLIICPSLHQADPVALLLPDAVWAAAIGRVPGHVLALVGFGLYTRFCLYIGMSHHTRMPMKLIHDTVHGGPFIS